MGTSDESERPQHTADEPAVAAASGHSESGRRRFLAGLTASVAALGAGFAAWPFIQSFWPSARARSAGGPVMFDLSALKPGEETVFEWRGKPIWVLHRTQDMLDRLNDLKHRHLLRDPDSAVASQQPNYAENATRSIRPEYFVVEAVCTHLGCVPILHPEVPSSELGPDWVGGYYCPCHGSRFDLAGRVEKGVPAPTNLVVPPHHFVDANTVVIGIDDT